jgi:hypothetical protein
MQSARFLKVLVIALGLAIVVALGFVIYGFVRLGSAPNQDANSTVPTLNVPVVGNLGQPVGTEITGMVPSGNTRLAVSLSGGGLPDRILVLDLKNGQVVTTTFASPVSSATTP